MIIGSASRSDIVPSKCRWPLRRSPESFELSRIDIRVPQPAQRNRILGHDGQAWDLGVLSDCDHWHGLRISMSSAEPGAAAPHTQNTCTLTSDDGGVKSRSCRRAFATGTGDGVEMLTRWISQATLGRCLPNYGIVAGFLCVALFFKDVFL